MAVALHQQLAPRFVPKIEEQPLLHNYKLGRTIGRGATSIVKLCEDTNTNKQFACKIISDNNFVFYHEAEIMQKLGYHPNILSLRDSLQDKEKSYLVMDLCNKDVQSCLTQGPLPEPIVAKIFVQLLCGLQHCHQKGVLHLDIKPQNILITGDGVVKLADFGYSRCFIPGQRFSGLVGTPAFMAPEVLMGNYGPATDLWSVGIVLYYMLSGYCPFEDSVSDELVLYDNITRANYGIPLWVSRDARSLIRGLLCKDESRRFTIDEALCRASDWLSRSSMPNTHELFNGPARQAVDEESGACGKLMSTFES